MSVQIDNVEQLQLLLRTCNLSVKSVEELKDLLATVNANYNPDAARVRVARLTGVAVPCTALGVAGGVSVFIAGIAGFSQAAPYALAALAIMWGGAALTSVVAVVMALVFLWGQRGAPAPGAPAAKARGGAGVPAFGERSANVIAADQLARPVG
jgi:hypothetical protein